MQIAQRVYSLAQQQNDPALLIGAYRAFACTLCFLGDFDSARKYATSGVQIWRSGGVQSPVEEIASPAVLVLLRGPIRVAFRRDRLLPSDHGGSDLPSEGAK